MGKRELVALLCLSSWCLVSVVLLFLTMPRICLQFVIVAFLDHYNSLFLMTMLSGLGLQYGQLSIGFSSIYGKSCISSYTRIVRTL